jgi:hypothetical protein
MERKKTLVTEDMHARKGVWTEPVTAPPIAASDIRKWAIAVYWPEKPPRLFWDEQYARGTRFGGIVAPEDFNPFAWPVEEPQWYGDARERLAAGQTGLNGGHQDVYGVRMRPGDVIQRRQTLSRWEERQGRFGQMLYLYNEARWTNQRGELVKTSTSIGIWY